MKKEKAQIKEKKMKEKPKKAEAPKEKAPKQKIVKPRKIHVHKRQKALDEKKSKLAVKARQTKWAPVWVVMKKYGMGKKIHPSATTKYRRSWRKTKLKIKPRRIRKWHMG